MGSKFQLKIITKYNDSFETKFNFLIQLNLKYYQYNLSHYYFKLKQVPTYIVDYSEAEQQELELCEEISRANVICLVYDLSDLSTLDQVRKRLFSFYLDDFVLFKFFFV